MRAIAANLLLLLIGSSANAAALQPFYRESLAQIETAHRGRPFILVLWSISCDYCRDELRLLNRLQQHHPQLDYVLVATDAPQESSAVSDALTQLAPAARESWLFADEHTPRLRFAIDRRWQGELPRNYLYHADGSRQPRAGRLDEATLLHWLQGEERVP